MTLKGSADRIRPSNCAIYVASSARRKDIIVSARGQSHPVDRFSLKRTTRMRRSSAISDGSTCGTLSPCIVNAPVEPKVCTTSFSLKVSPMRSSILAITSSRSVSDTFVPGASADLDNEYRIYIGVMLFISVLIPVLTLVLPFICCGLKHGHVTVLGRIIWIGDDDSIFQQTRLANLCRRNDHLMQGRAGSPDQPVY